MEKFLTEDQARKIVESGQSVYEVILDSDGRVRDVLPIRSSEALDEFVYYYSMVWRDPPELMSFSQLRMVPNVYCHSDRIDILIKACDV